MRVSYLTDSGGFDTSSIFGLAIPSCYPNKARRATLSETNIKQLSKFKDILTLLINFQPPWDEESIKSVTDLMDYYGLNYKYAFNEYQISSPGEVPCCKIRNDSIILKDCKIYCIFDDDRIFVENTGSTRPIYKQFVDAIHYMTNHPKCGLLRFTNECYPRHVPREYTHHNIIYPNKCVCWYNTAFGMFIRNIENIPGSKGRIMPEDTLSLVGGGEEKIIASYLLDKGYWGATLNSPCVADVKQVGPERKGVRGWLTSRIIGQNVDHYIRTNFSIGGEYKGIGCYKLVDPDYWMSKGGIDVKDKELIKTLIVNYDNMDYKEEIQEIIDYWKVN